MGDDTAEPDSVDAAVAMGFTEECAGCMLAGGRRLSKFRKLAGHESENALMQKCFDLSDEMMEMMNEGDDDHGDHEGHDHGDDDDDDDDDAGDDDDDDDDATSSAAAFALLVGYFA